jgi:hypothetical protein
VLQLNFDNLFRLKFRFIMTDLRTVTILYGEKKLQKTIAIPSSTTVKDTKKICTDELLKHLQSQSGVPSISIDDECTDFYPGMIQS